MASGLTLPIFPFFDPDCEQSSLSQRWTKWLSRFENFLIAANVSNNSRKRALLLHHAGERVHDIFDTLENTGAMDDYDAAKTSLTKYFTPKKNTAFEVLVFRRDKQTSSETLDQFHTRLQALAAHCDFGNKDNEIKNQIIQNCASSRLRRRILELKPEDSTLSAILDIGRRMESANRDAQEIEGRCENTIFQVRRFADQPSTNECDKCGSRLNQQYKSFSKAKPVPSAKCRNCGGPYPHAQGQTSCPAYNTTCFSCAKRGHFSAVCRSTGRSNLSTNMQYNQPAYQPFSQSAGAQSANSRQQVRNVIDVTPDSDMPGEHGRQVRTVSDTTQYVPSDNSDHEYCYPVTRDIANNVHDVKPEVDVLVNGVKTTFMIDTGSTIDTITERDYNHWFQDKFPLQPYNNIVFPYAINIALPIIGIFHVEISSHHTKIRTVLHVVKHARDSLLSYTTSKLLQLVQITNSAVSPPTDSAQQITREDIDRLHGLYDRVVKELERLERLDAAEPATMHMASVSPIATSTKHTDPCGNVMIKFTNPLKPVKHEDNIIAEHTNHDQQVRPATLTIGDTVLVKQRKARNLDMPSYNTVPYRVTNIDGSQITVKRGNHTITRHATHFQLLPSDIDAGDNGDVGSDDNFDGDYLLDPRQHITSTSPSAKWSRKRGTRQYIPFLIQDS